MHHDISSCPSTMANTASEDWQFNKSPSQRNQYMLENQVKTDVTFIIGEGKGEQFSTYVQDSQNSLGCPLDNVKCLGHVCHFNTGGSVTVPSGLTLLSTEL